MCPRGAHPRDAVRTKSSVLGLDVKVLGLGLETKQKTESVDTQL